MLNDKQKYYGAALYQITQNDCCTANRRLDDRTYRINDQAIIYFKHATRPTRPTNQEYQFTFTFHEVDRFHRLRQECDGFFLCLICVESEQICCLSFEEFQSIWERRQLCHGDYEPQFVLKVAVPFGKSFRVYADYPGRRRCYLGKPMIITRNDFPNRVFVQPHEIVSA